MYPKTPFSGYVRLIKVTANLRYPIGFKNWLNLWMESI